MEKSSFKLKNNYYLDSKNIVNGRELLSNVLMTIPICDVNGFSKSIDNTDVNTICKSGFYHGNDIINTPNAWGYLIVIGHSYSYDYCIQIFLDMGFNDTHIYTRKKYGAEWSQWIAH